MKNTYHRTPALSIKIAGSTGTLAEIISLRTLIVDPVIAYQLGQLKC
jgi:hypothetical protein